jgi:hypothetical protein
MWDRAILHLTIKTYDYEHCCAGFHQQEKARAERKIKD